MKKAFSFGMAVMAMLMVFSGVALASAVTNPQDRTFTTSEIMVGNAGAECEQLGIALGLGEGAFAYAYKFNEDGEEGAPNETETAEFKNVDTGSVVHSNDITISNSNIIDGYFDWSSSPNGIGAVMVKAGTGYNVWHYDPQEKSDTHLFAYEGKGVSHVTFCWNLDAAPPAQEWCSPGYWRQDHHLDSWEATGFATTDSFYAELGYSVTLSKKGERAGANTAPTLLEVLQNPQFYGGDDFNAVGDLLSAAHPDVNFDGLRVEDSCPLN